MLKWLRALSLGKKIGLGVVSLFAISAISGASNQTNSNLPTVVDNPPNSTSTKTLPVVKAIETKTITEDEAIPFESITQNDSTITNGQTSVATAGVNGVKSITYKITLENGVETNREKISEAVTKQPVTQVTKIGTYVAPVLNCPNGTYVNTYGNTVCSPYQAPSAPAGATAQCVDGTYSFSQSRSGTCSHHGGVSSWL